MQSLLYGRRDQHMFTWLLFLSASSQNSDSTIIVILLLGFVALIVMACVFGASRRRKAWQNIARDAWLDFSRDDEELTGRFPFKALLAGEDSRATFKVEGDVRGHQVVLGDFECRRPQMHSNKTHCFTFCIVSQKDVTLPVATLAPEVKLEGFAARITEALGVSQVEDIDFEDDNEFSEAFCLLSDDEHAAREAFGPAIRRFLLDNRGGLGACVLETGSKGILLVAIDPRAAALISMSRGGEETVPAVSTGILVQPGKAKALMELGIDLIGEWKKQK